MSVSKPNINAVFRKDFLWYFVGSVIPMMIGFIRTPIFTRHFSSASFGELGLVSIAFSFFGMFLFSWISSCLWRYYGKYKASERLPALYSNLVFLFAISMVLMTGISLVWMLESSRGIIRELIAYSLLQLLFNQLLMGYLVVVRLRGKSRYHTVFQGIRSILGLAVSLTFVFYLQWGIEALVSSLALVDALGILILTLLNPVKIKLQFREINRPVLTELLQYGSLGLILNFSLLSISYSDRYVIAMFDDIDRVGIYDQVAKIAQLSVMALVTIYFNTINPYLLKRLESDFKGSLPLIHSFLFSFVLFGLPVIFYLSLFSEELAGILLGKAFREGYVLMPFIFMSAYLQGLSNFFELRLKFSDKIKKLGLIALSTAILNIVLNLVFVSAFGYQWAAYTTLISYFVLVLSLFIDDPQVLEILRTKRRIVMEIATLLVIQYLCYIFLIEKFSLSRAPKITTGVIFALIYFLYFRKTIRKIELPMK